MSDLNFLPSLGLKGLYRLKSPFDTQILPTTQYVCTGVQKLSASAANGDDPFETYYQSIGATQTDYDADVAVDAYLVTITSGEGEVYTFPNTALISLPIVDGVIYRNMAMVVSLGAVMDDADLDVLSNDIVQHVLRTTGISTSVYLSQIGPMTVVTQEQSDALEKARALKIEDSDSLILKLEKAEQDNQKLRDLIGQYEAYMKENISKLS
jgi:hypothetical protein